MTTVKKTNSDFFSQLYNSWIRVDDAYLQDKKNDKSRADESKK